VGGRDCDDKIVIEFNEWRQRRLDELFEPSARLAGSRDLRGHRNRVAEARSIAVTAMLYAS
jgi:hypothetical protein